MALERSFADGPRAPDFARDGAAHVRAALDPALLARLRAAAERVLGERDLLAAEGRLPPELRDDQVRRFVHLDHLGFAEPVLPQLLRPAFVAAAAAYLGHAPEIAGQAYVRSIRVTRPDTHLPFHQDETILGRRCVNVWIALARCGADAPGLELALGAGGELLPVSPPPGARFPVERARIEPREVLARLGERALWRPVCELGDALLFRGSTPHRTHAAPGMTADRLSIELRLV